MTLLGGAATWPLVVGAQQPMMPVVGFINNTITPSNRVTAFLQGLNEAGFSEGRNVAIEFRSADNQLDTLPALADDLVRRRVAVIVANVQSAPAVKRATSTIPIVFVSGGDPVDIGLVTGLNRGAGNVTGVSFNAAPVNPKRLELLHELVPKPSIIAVLFDPNSPDPDTVSRNIEAAARTLSREILVVKAGSATEINAAFATIIQAGARALFVGNGAFFVARRQQIVALACRHALPAIYPAREYVDAGGLTSYGASAVDAYRRAGIYVGRIPKGEKPGDLPVELPTKYELVINLKTAKALGLTVPRTLLALADEIIE
jgi:putative ABC transport system substrate-binding protein